MKKYLFACLCVCLCLALVACGPGESASPTPSPSLSPSPSASEPPEPSVTPPRAVTDPIMHVGDVTLDGVDLNFYYYPYVNDPSLAQYGLDPAKPLSEQMLPDGSQTWEAYFYDYAVYCMQHLERTTCLWQEARALGMELNAEKKAMLDSEMARMESECEADQSLDNYLVQTFGEGMTQERVTQIMERQLLGMQLEDEKMDLTFSEDELRAYHEEKMPGEELDAGKTINVRHILISTRKKAEDTYAEWQAGDKTEESFAALATQYTEDTSSQTLGGLYENVPAGQMVETFDDWCFDPARKPGDTGLVDSEYGTHVMYFVGEGEAPWLTSAREMKLSEIYTQYLDELKAKYPVEWVVYIQTETP